MLECGTYYPKARLSWNSDFVTYDSQKMLLEPGKQTLALYPGCRISFGLTDGGEEHNNWSQWSVLNVESGRTVIILAKYTFLKGIWKTVGHIWDWDQRPNSHTSIMFGICGQIINSTFWYRFWPYSDNIRKVHISQNIWKTVGHIWEWDQRPNSHTSIMFGICGQITLILPRSRTGTVWFYTSTSNKRAARPKLYTKSLTRDLRLMYSRFTLVRISIKL